MLMTRCHSSVIYLLLLLQRINFEKSTLKCIIEFTKNNEFIYLHAKNYTEDMKNQIPAFASKIQRRGYIQIMTQNILINTQHSLLSLTSHELSRSIVKIMLII